MGAGNKSNLRMPGINEIFNTLTGNGINKKDGAGDTRLYRAVRAGSFNEVRRLLKEGADPNIKNAKGLSPLHQACYWGETDIVEILLRYNADANAGNGRGWTPLHSAAISGGRKVRKSIIEMLEKAGGRSNIPDKHGWTAADYMQLWDENAPAAEKLRKHMGEEGAKHPEETRGKLRKGFYPKH